MTTRLFLILSLLLTLACAQKQTQVILLPQDDGSTGAVTLRSQGSAVTLDKPYMLSSSGTMQAAQGDPEVIKKTYGNLFKMELKRPQVKVEEPEEKPVTFILHFENRSTALTEASREKLPEIHQLLRKMPPTRIRVIGYTDTVGDREANLTLSSKRADQVARILNRKDRNSNRMEIRGYGEHGPMITTPDNTPEPRNRRVKIYIYPPVR